MGIIGASIAVGVSHRDVEVVENAYEAGLQFDHLCKRKAELAWQVEVPRKATKGDAGLELTVRDQSGKAIPNARVSVRAFRLGTRAEQTVACVSRGNGRYAAPLRFDADGAWNAVVEVAANDDVLTFENTVSVH